MKTPPIIFSTQRKIDRLSRSYWRLSENADPARFILNEMGNDIVERLSFLRLAPKVVLQDRLGFAFRELIDSTQFCYRANDYGEPFYEGEAGLLPNEYDLVLSLASLDTVNDIPGALIQMRTLLEPGGLAIASFVGGASLPKLRRAMLEAEPERPAARMHPLIDSRSCPQLLARAGWVDPVVDTFTLTVRYSSMDRLVHDLRDQALNNVLAFPAPPLTRAAAERARAAFLAQADPDGMVSEVFEIVTLTGRRSLRGA